MEPGRLSRARTGPLRRLSYAAQRARCGTNQRVISGGEVDNWHAYAINSASPSPVPWTSEALFRYLRDGWDADHGLARGPMAEVVGNLSTVPESDVRAIATYMASVFGPPSQDRNRQTDEVRAQVKSPPHEPALTSSAGAAIYAAACATCHESERPLPYGGVNLGLSTALSAPDPRNAANIILSGIRPLAGERSPIMPGFADSMSDAQISELLNYLRARFSRQAAWSGVEKTVQEARRAQTALLLTSPGTRHAPADRTERDKP